MTGPVGKGSLLEYDSIMITPADPKGLGGT